MSILNDIIRDMYVDPELLEQLSMEQRDVLFRKMREEQIRRWRLKEDELEKKDRARPPRRTKVEWDI
jgi:SH2 domain-containing protein 4A